MSSALEKIPVTPLPTEQVIYIEPSDVNDGLDDFEMLERVRWIRWLRLQPHGEALPTF